MRLRSNGLVGAACGLAGFAVLSAISASVGSGVDGATRAVAGVIAVLLIGVLVRIAMVGLQLEPNRTTVRELLGTYRLDRAEVLGLAVERVAHGRFQRIVVVCTEGRVIPASWTVAGASNSGWVAHAEHVAHGFGETQAKVSTALADHDRLEADSHLPLATRDPGLTPQTVSPVDPGPQSRWLGWETVFVVTAFALPGLAAAITLLAKHIGGVEDLNDFDLPLPHHPGISLFLMILEYSTTALVVPIALLMLARTGQLPSRLGLTRRGIGTDTLGALGMIVGAFALTGLLALAMSPLSDQLSNTKSDSHVPAYYLIYAVLLSATTAINEEVIVNGYFLTRLSQLGWTRWSAFALSFAVRESYHVYYGLGFLLTVPFGYLMTRSFQKRGRLARPIIAHFVYDLILLSVAVLTS